jgi:hypothetical protein
MMHFLLLQKLARVPLKNRFCLAIIISGLCKYILTLLRCIYYISSRGFLALPTCRYIQEIFFNGFNVVSPWFPMVSDGSTWLTLVILGYLWLYLVILGYTWLSTIQIYVKSFAHLQLFFPSFAEIFCSRGQIK